MSKHHFLYFNNVNGGFSSIFLIFLVVVLGAVAVFWWQRPKNEPQTEIRTDIVYTEQENTSDALPQTPQPFEEMTIPYLREREYQSSIGELNVLSESATYTSYLTSYDSDGLRINGLLTRPKGDSPAGGWPAIVFIHGYIPPTLYETTERYVSYVDYLARNGFVVFKIDLRGHDNSEGEAGGAYYSSDYIIDTLNAKAALQSLDFVDANAIGLWGHSMAGNVVLRSVAVDPDIKAAVIWAGAVYSYEDMQAYGIDDNSYRPPSTTSQRTRRRQELFDAQGQFSPDSDFWKQVAPTNYLNDIKAAVQIHHAVNDPVVSIEYTRNLNNLLDQSTVQHQVFEYQSGGHDIEGSSFGQAMQRTVDFFAKNMR